MIFRLGAQKQWKSIHKAGRKSIQIVQEKSKKDVSRFLSNFFSKNDSDVDIFFIEHLIG